MPVYSQDDLVVPILDLLAVSPGGLTTTELRRTLWERLTPTGDNAEPSPSRPGERKFDQIVRNTTGPERRMLTGLVTFGGPGQPMTITEAGRQRLAAARASGEWAGFGIPVHASGGMPIMAEEQRPVDVEVRQPERPTTEPTEPHRRRGPAATGFGRPYRPVDASTPGAPRVPFTVDPNTLDRGTTEHKRSQTIVADTLRALGIEPVSPGPDDPDFDIGWRVGEIWFVAEVKSITAANEATQVRLGIAQVLEYRYILRDRHQYVRAVLMLEREPDLGRWSDFLTSLGIDLVWPETLEAYLLGLQASVARLPDLE